MYVVSTSRSGQEDVGTAELKKKRLCRNFNLFTDVSYSYSTANWAFRQNEGNFLLLGTENKFMLKTESAKSNIGLP